MNSLSKYNVIDIIKYICGPTKSPSRARCKVISFRNYALVNKTTLQMANEYLSYKKRQFKLYNIPKTHNNCLYRLKVTNIKKRYSSFENEWYIKDGGFVLLPPGCRGGFETIILITKIYYPSKKELIRINFVVVDGEPYPSIASINELLDENFICIW